MSSISRDDGTLWIIGIHEAPEGPTGLDRALSADAETNYLGEVTGSPGKAQGEGQEDQGTYSS